MCVVEPKERFKIGVGYDSKRLISVSIMAALLLTFEVGRQTVLGLVEWVEGYSNVDWKGHVIGLCVGATIGVALNVSGVRKIVRWARVPSE